MEAEQIEESRATPENKIESSPEQEHQEKLRAVKASILERKKRAARIRNALCRKSKILKIKLWQSNVAAQSRVQNEKSPTPSPPPVAERSPSPPSPSPSPPPLSHRFSPDITCYRLKPLLLSPVKKRSDSRSSKSSSKSSSSSSSSNSEHEEEADDEREEEGDKPDNEGDDDREDSNSCKSVDSSDESGPKIPPQLLLSSRGEPVVKLDASIVEDFIRSGKPIRAAALAALEAVHGKKFTDIDLHRLRKAYIVKPSVPKGRGRRSIYKKNTKPTRGPKLGNWCSVVNSLTYKNQYFQVGDIVGVKGEDARPYFLQIQSLMMDWKEGEAFGSMLWLTPKEDFKGPRFPFHPKNYNLRRDIGSLDCSMDNVTHILHCPLDFFDGHPSFWRPIPGTVYQRLGEPLVKWVKFDQPKPPASEETKEEGRNSPTNDDPDPDLSVSGEEDATARPEPTGDSDVEDEDEEEREQEEEEQEQEEGEQEQEDGEPEQEEEEEQEHEEEDFLSESYPPESVEESIVTHVIELES